jgi:POLR3C, C-terminal winged-helix domain
LEILRQDFGEAAMRVFEVLLLHGQECEGSHELRDREKKAKKEKQKKRARHSEREAERSKRGSSSSSSTSAFGGNSDDSDSDDDVIEDDGHCCKLRGQTFAQIFAALNEERVTSTAAAAEGLAKLVAHRCVAASMLADAKRCWLPTSYFSSKMSSAKSSTSLMAQRIDARRVRDQAKRDAAQRRARAASNAAAQTLFDGLGGGNAINDRGDIKGKGVAVRKDDGMGDDVDVDDDDDDDDALSAGAAKQRYRCAYVANVEMVLVRLRLPRFCALVRAELGRPAELLMRELFFEGFQRGAKLVDAVLASAGPTPLQRADVMDALHKLSLCRFVGVTNEDAMSLSQYLLAEKPRASKRARGLLDGSDTENDDDDDGGAARRKRLRKISAASSDVEATDDDATDDDLLALATDSIDLATSSASHSSSSSSSALSASASTETAMLHKHWSLNMLELLTFHVKFMMDEYVLNRYGPDLALATAVLFTLQDPQFPQVRNDEMARAGRDVYLREIERLYDDELDREDRDSKSSVRRERSRLRRLARGDSSDDSSDDSSLSSSSSSPSSNDSSSNDSSSDDSSLSSSSDDDDTSRRRRKKRKQREKAKRSGKKKRSKKKSKKSSSSKKKRSRNRSRSHSRSRTRGRSSSSSSSTALSSTDTETPQLLKAIRAPRDMMRTDDRFHSKSGGAEMTRDGRPKLPKVTKLLERMAYDSVQLVRIKDNQRTDPTHPDTPFTLCCRHIAQQMRDAEIESYVLRRFGVYSLRIFRFVRLQGAAEETQIGTECIVQPNVARSLLLAMYQAGVMHIQSVPRSSDRQPVRTIYAWTVDIDQLCAHLSATGAGIMRRLLVAERNVLSQRHVAMALLAKRTAKNQNDLPHAHSVALRDALKKLQSLAGAISRLDESLFIYNLFAFPPFY